MHGRGYFKARETNEIDRSSRFEETQSLPDLASAIHQNENEIYHHDELTHKKRLENPP
jgi:hypothetical protein